MNLLLSETMQQILGIDLGIHVFWIWLNFTGVLLTLVIAYLVSWLMPGRKATAPALEVTYPGWKAFRRICHES